MIQAKQSEDIMSFANSMIQIEFKREVAKNEKHLEISLHLKEIFQGLFHALFIGPRMVRKVHPYKSVPIQNYHGPLF